MTVVTLAGPDGPRGLTVNSFTSVSLDPPLVLVSIAKKARSHDEFDGAPFAVNVLSTEQEPLALKFAGQEQDGMTVPWVGGTNVPRIDRCVAWLECAPWRSYDGGDHTLFLGEVVDFGQAKGDALGFYSGHFVPLPSPVPSQPAPPFDPFEMPYDAL